MEFEVLGWPEDSPWLHLDYRQFSYAGKFVMTSTGKAVALASGADVAPEAILERSDGGDPASPGNRDPIADGVLAAVAFNEDRTDHETLWLRYVTVRVDRRGEGIGPSLVGFVCDQARDRGYRRARIAVNNPFAYHALYKAGFHYTGDQTGIAELVLDRGLESYGGFAPDPDRYREGLAVFDERDLQDDERAFLDAKRRSGPPDEPLTGDVGGARE